MTSDRSQIRTIGREIRRIGVLGGTFDPIHLGHLVVAEEVMGLLLLDRVFFVPSARPPHKMDTPISPAEERYRMVDMAIQDNPRLEILDSELKRSGPSYTVDTIAELRRRLDGQIYFIMGLDSLEEMITWKRPDELVNICHVVVTTRPGYDFRTIDHSLKEKVTFVEVTEIGISSTEIRRRVREGLPIRYLVPRMVEEYIAERGLYR